jgi:aminopeptidase N
MKPTRVAAAAIGLVTLVLPVLATSCMSTRNSDPASTSPDPHSCARPNDVVVRHIDLDLAVDFGEKTLAGTATIGFENRTGAPWLFLDTRDLAIEKVTVGDGAVPARFELGPDVKYLGRSLAIDVPPGATRVVVHYATSPSAAALQWLEPEQTAGGKKPFLLTQSQAILARTWVPCQDTPGVRMTYAARIKAPPGFMAVMSAENATERSADGTYTFRMRQRIPSYLLALAVGDFDFKATGPRTGVFAEPPTLEKAAYEFADTEKMVAATEALYGPYLWGRYDLIVLPPSFPFGGMENPRVTFLTPTVIAGDRSLVSLVAHELAHSWSGNLVTNATWADFWLNEGFTVYLERRIMESLYGRDYSEMLASLSLEELKKTVADLSKETPNDTRLRLDLLGRDPDDGVTDIAYEKGYFFLRHIEESVGRERFDAFLRSYFDAFSFRSLDTNAFLVYLRENLVRGDAALAAKIGAEEWVDGRGLPASCPVPQSTALAKAEAEAKRFVAGTPAADLKTANWSTHEWLHFLRSIPYGETAARLADLDAAFQFTSSGNSEILCDFLQHAIASRYEAAYPALERFLTRVGRRKFLKPLYEKMAASPETLELGKSIYAKARPGYHAVSVRTIDEIMKWST